MHSPARAEAHGALDDSRRAVARGGAADALRALLAAAAAGAQGFDAGGLGRAPGESSHAAVERSVPGVRWRAFPVQNKIP